jgi:hypothetical protein
MSRRHDSFREGSGLGLVVATAIWLWIAAVDMLVGQPFRTFAVLGGLLPFTVLHYLLNVVYAVAIVSAIHGARREPSLVIAVAFGFFIIEFAFAMLTVLLSHVGLGELAWVRILGGNLIGALIAFFIVSRRHPLVQEFRQAEEEESEEA